MNKLAELWKKQPIIVIGAVEALLGLAIAFGLDMSKEQVGAILVALPAIAAALGWTQVSPATSNRWGMRDEHE